MKKDNRVTERSRRLFLVRENRIFREKNGSFSTDDPALAGYSWRLPFDGISTARLVCRVETQGAPRKYRVEGEVLPLPHYRGAVAAGLKAFNVWYTLLREVRRGDVVVVRVPGPIGLAATLAASAKRAKIAAEVVGDVADVALSGAGGSAVRSTVTALVLLTRWQVRRALVVRYVTSTYLQERYPAALEARQVSVSDVQVTLAPRGSRAYVPHSLVAVGSQEQLYKGHHILIDAVALLRQTFPEVNLTLVGSGARQDQLRTYAQSRGVANCVNFAGYINDRDYLASVVVKHEIFVMPSLTEGLPRALIEAMALGLPCIGSKAGGIPELLPEESLVDAGDAVGLAERIGDFFQNPKLQDRVAAKGLQRAEEFAGPAQDLKLNAWLQLVTELLEAEK